MKKIFKTVLALSVIGSAASYADAVLISDDFTSGSVANHVRFRPNQLNTWGKNNNWDSLWTIENGTLANATTAAGVPSEGGVGQVIKVSDKTTDTSLSKISVSFDYTVGTGSILYFHLQGLTENGSPATNEELANPTAQNGFIQNAADTQYGDMSILDGSDPNTGTGGTASFAAGTSGTYTKTFDLTGYSWHADEDPGLTGSIANVTDFDLILAAFASNVTETDGSGALSIDNFSVSAIPEPATLGLIAAFGGGVLFIRRMFQM